MGATAAKLSSARRRLRALAAGPVTLAVLAAIGVPALAPPAPPAAAGRQRSGLLIH